MNGKLGQPVDIMCKYRNFPTKDMKASIIRKIIDLLTYDLFKLQMMPVELQ